MMLFKKKVEDFDKFNKKNIRTLKNGRLYQ